MHKKISILHSELRSKVVWAKNVKQNEIINKHRFDMFVMKVNYEFRILDRYMKNLNNDDYKYIVENILPDYEVRNGE